VTEDPTLFTSFEWVLAAMAALIALVLFALVQRATPGSPFAARDERWLRDKSASAENKSERV